MKWKIGFRTIKTAIGTGLAVAFAEWLGLRYFISAGVIATLCIQTSRKKSYETAWDRFVACLVVVPIAVGIFLLLGYNPLALTLILLLSIPLLVYLKLKDSILTSNLIMFHLYIEQSITTSFLLNELGILAIGIFFGLIINFYMPHSDKKLIEYQVKIEDNFRKILHEMAVYLCKGESDWTGSEILETAKWIKDAKELALISKENKSDEKEKYFHRYFKMRSRQFDILERIMPMVSHLPRTVPQGKRIAEFLERISSAVHPGNTADLHLEELYSMMKEFKEQPLPKTREEFETRAILLQLVHEMERYLMIKKYLVDHGYKKPGKGTLSSTTSSKG
ncbi:aromatic acid exporter family protein [Risungbinella massiliensis]|uniref:aromatic acid exporter family protein n=1 Tax=Risungbinella massiliensis TaxID=1329796 RepID=UPI0006997E43|nr:aromatic acid exporter family protein [Risungbinella massiliensis]